MSFELSEDLKSKIESQISQSPVVLFMKGSPAMPQCGFSAAVANILKELAVPFSHVNILADPELREGLKAYANWPTYPQLWVKGELLGGCDIVRDMHKKGELKPLLQGAGT